jgi:hypothetical protein
MRTPPAHNKAAKAPVRVPVSSHPKAVGRARERSTHSVAVREMIPQVGVGQQIGDPPLGLRWVGLEEAADLGMPQTAQLGTEPGSVAPGRMGILERIGVGVVAAMLSDPGEG